MSGAAGLPGHRLPARARAAIAERLGLGRRLSREGLDRRLLAPGASFVTLTEAATLRGCVGSLEAHRPLVEDVEANACAAGFEDSRFPALTAAEFAPVRIEVSVLGPLAPLTAADESELLRRLEPGVDGLLLVAGGRRATFLPQVWQALPKPRDFVDHLRRKAGLDPDFWRLGPSFFRYRVDKWGEGDGGNAGTGT